MARPLRLSFEGAVYHVMARGNRKENIFFTDRDRQIFLKKMDETFTKYSVICYAYCLMSNHYHLFMKTLLPNISFVLHYLNSSYANWLKAKNKLVGPVFQGRYKSILVEENRYALALSVYLHLNPLRSGLVHSLEQYPWSSYPDYLGIRKPAISRLDKMLVLAQVSEKAEQGLERPENESKRLLQAAANKYKDYVLAMAKMSNPLGEAYKGIILGSAEFIERMKRRIAALGAKREIPETRSSSSGSLSVDGLIEIMTVTLGINEEVIFRRGAKQRRNIYFQLFLYLLKKFSSMSLKEIGNFVDLDYAAVYQTTKRFEEKLKVDLSAKSMKEKAEKAISRWNPGREK